MPQRQVILSPYYLDVPLDTGSAFEGGATLRNAPRLDGTGQKERLTQLHEPLAALVESSARAGRLPVSVAGDCCATIAVVAGLQRAGIDPVMVWLDAHGDFNTWETSPSGFVGGMPLAMLVGRGDQALVAGVRARTLREADVVLSDARDLDPGERQALESSQVLRVGSVTDVLASVPRGRPLYVHFDPDVISPVDAPAMHYPTAGGSRLAIVEQVCASLARTGRVVAASMTLWDFEKDGDGRTARACQAALEALTSGG